MEQLLQIEYNSGIPVYKQLINLIITAVNNEQLLIGEKLPPLRKLAEQLDINVNTVAKVYKELELWFLTHFHLVLRLWQNWLLQGRLGFQFYPNVWLL